ncbi:diguanylate cyclase domain-containing protein [Bacillus sp. V5-8f]|uniref:sensor domain-containing diguanylate cyclase n=1 Tax=Bacillus sp. V5-8f TaxID=2053044 RepID=UPI000C77D668|nr:diguanylate cyclase [Bacillus sp. V5-8f]PLT33125.1 diguanylate cyclase [Bacillus sp. V5-8f]
MGVSNSLRARLSITFGLMVFILICTLSIIIGQRSVKEVETEIGNSLGEAAYTMGENLDQYMWSRYGEVSLLSELKELRDPQDVESIENLLNKLQENFPSFAWVGFTDKDGNVLASTHGILRDADISARPVYREALEETFIGDVHEAVLLAKLLPNPSGEELKFVDISTPVYGYDNQFIGVLATHLSREWMKEVKGTMVDSLENRKGIEFFIVSEKNNDVILGPNDMLGKPLNIKSVGLAGSEKKGWTIETWEDGKQYLTGYVRADGYKNYKGLGWTVLVRQPVEVAYAPVKEELKHYYVITGMVFVILFALGGWLIAAQITQPLKRITKVADRLSEGDTVEIPPYKGINEIESLSNSLRNLITNLTKTETALEKMEIVAHHDHLTGLPNRKALDIYLESATRTYETLTILYLDLDGFKAVNDKLGHDAGDILLKQVALRLRQNITSDEYVSRLGGDEFIIVLTSINDPIKQAKIIGEKIISMINKPYYINGETVHVGCSVGGAVWDGLKYPGVHETIKQADQALYNVKRTGKNRVYIYEKNIDFAS